MTGVPVIAAEAAAFAYPGGTRPVGPFSVAMHPGDVWLLTGPSGSGKSTLARMLAGLIPHLYRGQLTGRVVVGGCETKSVPLWRVTEDVGLVMQNPAGQLLARTAEMEVAFGLENLGLPAPEIRRRVTTALERFGIAHARGRDPLSLSGGEQQRLVIAAIWARQPRALVLDEPVSMLDGNGAGGVVDAVGQLQRDSVAVCVAEHRWARFAALPGVRRLDLAGAAGADGPLPTLPGAVPAVRVTLAGVTCALAGQPVLTGIDLTLTGGDVVAVVGANGAGKTTLLRILGGLQPSQGRIEATVGGERRPPRLGLCFQNPDRQLFNASVREEICYGSRRVDEAHYQAVVSLLGLEGYEETPPLLLSEGEKKRLALATLLLRPDLDGFCLDEPTLGQDARHRRLLGRMLRALARSGYVCVVASHDPDWVAEWCDRVVVLRDGRLEAVGPPPPASLPDAGRGVNEECRSASPSRLRGRGEGERSEAPRPPAV